MPALLTSLRQGTGGSDRLDDSCRDTLDLSLGANGLIPRFPFVLWSHKFDIETDLERAAKMKDRQMYIIYRMREES